MRWKPLVVTLFTILALSVVHSSYYNENINPDSSDFNLSDAIDDLFDIVLEEIPEEEDECMIGPQNDSECFDDYWENNWTQEVING